MNTEAQIQADIALLREQIADTQELYREVCVVLFFRHGITPTANKLYQYVRKGSMSAPAEALAKFWENLREKSRIRIEHPDLPDALKTAAGDLVATIWSQAQGAAEATLASLRSDAKASIQDAEARLRDAGAAKDAAVCDLRDANEEINLARSRIRELEQTLAGEVATRDVLEAQLASANQAVTDQHQAMAEARRDFSSELEKLRDALKVTEERHEAAESRALLEIDRERTITTKLQKELDLVRTSAADMAGRHRAELRTLQDEIGNQKKCLGNLEGELRAVNASRDQLVIELTHERASVLELSTKVAAAIRATDTWQQQAIDAQSELLTLRAAQQRKVRNKAKEPGAPQGAPKRGRVQSS
ncbi:MAG: DNA-binding protein [Pseudomonadota bacterium]